MADTFRQVIEVALKATNDPNLRTLLTTLRDLGATGDLTEEQLAELQGGITGVSEELQKLDAATGAIATLRKLSQETLTASRAFQASQKEAAALGKSLQEAYAKRTAAADAASKAEGAAAKATRKELAEAEREVRKLEAAYEKAQNSTRALSTALESKTAAVKRTKDALRAAGVDTQRLSSEQQRLGSEAAKASGAMQAQVAAVRAQAEAARVLRERTAAVESAILKFNSAGRASADALSVYRARAAEAGDVTRKLGAESTATTQKFDALEAGLGKIGALAASVAAAIGGIRFGADQFQGTVELQSRLAEVQAVSGAAGAALGRLRNEAQLAAEDTGTATEAVTSGMGELARAGFDAEQTISAIRPALDLAQAGAILLNDAIGITTTTLTQFGLEAEDARRVADVLAQAANSSQTSVQGLGLSLSYAAPLARQLGLNLEETTAIIAALGDEGFRGERAGTALRNVFSALLDPSSKFRGELARLGITGNDFTKILQQLAEKGEAGKQALLALDSEARPAIAALFLKGGESIAKYVDELQRAEGASANTAAIIRDTLSNAFTRIGEVVDNTFADLIDPVLKPLQEEIELLAANIKTFAESPEFAKLQAQLKLAFVDGLAAVRQYAQNVDYDQMAADLGGFVESVGAAATAIGELAEFLALLEKAANNSLFPVREAAEGLREAILLLADGFDGGADRAERLAKELAKVNDEQSQLNNIVETGKVAFDSIADAVDRVANRFGLFGRESDGARESAERVAEALGIIGVEAKKSAATITEEGQKIINALNVLATEAATTGEQFTAAFEKGIQSATTVAEIEKMRAALRVAFEDGKLSVVEYETALAKANNKLGEVKAAAEKAAGGMTAIGDAAVAAAKVAIAQAEAIRAAYVAEAQRLAGAMAAAIKQYGAESPQVSELGKQVQETDKRIAQQNQTIEKNRELVDAAGEAGKKAGEKTAEGFDQSSKAADGAVESTKKVSEAAEEAAGGLSEFINRQIEFFTEKFAAVSENAVKLFDELRRSSVAGAQGLYDVLDALSEAAAEVDRQIETQRRFAEFGAKAYEDFANGVDDAASRIVRLGVDSEESMRALAEQIRAGQAGVDLLDQATLDGLGSAIDRAADRVRALADEARQAKEELQGIADSLQDELDRRAGNDSAILERAYQEQLRRIEELARTGGAAARQQAEQARALAEQNYQQELATLREREATQREEARRTADTRIEEARRANAAIEQIQQPTQRNDLTSRGELRVVMQVENNQRSADQIIAELSDSALEQLGAFIVQRIARDLRGMGVV